MTDIREAKKIVFKVGTSTLTYESGGINYRRMEGLVSVLSDLQNSGKQVILVTSAAIEVGKTKMKLDHRPYTTAEKQAIAAIGQCTLMTTYERMFSNYGHTAAQVLLTIESYENDKARENAKNTFDILLSMGCIPVVNENDTVSFAEIEFGDNDTLSASVADIVGADALVILSDIDGFYDGDPKEKPDAKLIEHISEINRETEEMAGGAGSGRGTGGLVTKLKAASLAMNKGIPMYLINGNDPKNIYRLLEGEKIGTGFYR